MKDIIKNINYYKSRSANNLQSEQVAYIPHLETDQIECVVNSYIMDGQRQICTHYKNICIRLKYIKFRPNTYHNRERYNNKNTPIIELVDNNIIQPFALFIDGRFIPWDIISISICPDASYIIIDIYNNNFKDLIGFKYAQILTLPEYVYYSTNRESLGDNVLFSFDDKGKFNIDNPSYSFILNKYPCPHIATSYLFTNEDVNVFDVSKSLVDINGESIEPKDLKLGNENVFLFLNGLFSTGVKDNIVMGSDWDFLDHTEDDFNDFAPKIQLVKSNIDLNPNPDIRVDGFNVTINNGSNENSDRYDFIIFINTEYTNSIDNIINVDNSYIQSYARLANTNPSNVNYIQLTTPFTLNMDRNANYDTNISNAIDTMLKYNSNAFKETFKRASNLDIVERTGKWVNETKRSEDNKLWIPRRHNIMNEEFIIMLVNGELYRYDHANEYKANYCIIPITDINDDDRIEFLRFKNVNNSISDLIVGPYNENDPEDGFAYYSPDYINEDMILFSTESLESDPYTYPSDGDQHFPVNYTIETNSKGLIRIVLENDFYYGKNLKVAYKNRYIHFQYKVPSSEDVLYSIDLKEHFLYCNDYRKFMIFHNGRKLDSNHYRLVLPVRTTTPFYEFKLYFSIPVNEGDNIDVLYCPSLIQDILYTPDTEISGNIVVDKSILNYGISSDLFMVWINGRKVPASCIKDISGNNMHIISDEHSTKNLCVTKYIPDIDVLTTDLVNQTSTWDSFINRHDITEICSMLGINPDGLTDQEADINDGSVDIKSVMYELIREQYIMNTGVDITKKFVYDYLDVDRSIAENDSNENDVILPAADANRQDNIDGTPWSDSSILKEEV